MMLGSSWTADGYASTAAVNTPEAPTAGVCGCAIGGRPRLLAVLSGSAEFRGSSVEDGASTSGASPSSLSSARPRQPHQNNLRQYP